MSRRPRFRYLTVHAVLVYAFLFAPILVLVVFSFNEARSGTTWTGFSTRWYSALTADAAVRRAFANTLEVAVASTLLATVLGTFAAFALARHRFRGHRAYSALVLVSLVAPEIVMGIALLVFFRRVVDVPLGLGTVILAHVTFCLAFVIVVVRARLARFDESLTEAAADLGATPAQTFLRVVLPLAAPGILGGAILAFVISLDDVVITFFTAGPGSTTLPIYILGEVRRGVAPSINALSTIVLVASLAVLALGAAVTARAARRSDSPSTRSGRPVRSPGTHR